MADDKKPAAPPNMPDHLGALGLERMKKHAPSDAPKCRLCGHADIRELDASYMCLDHAACAGRRTTGRQTKGTAEQRTISIFTGKMDIEDQNARDGYEPSTPERRRRIAPKPRVQWRGVYGTMNAWESETTRHRIDLDAGGHYNLTDGGVRVGCYSNLVDAVAAAEAT